MDDLSQFRSQVIQATLKPSKYVEESHEGVVSREGVDPNVNGSELASAVKKAGGLSLLEKVLEKKAEPDQTETELDEKRRQVISMSSAGMIAGIMGSVNHSPKVREAAEDDKTFKPMPKEQQDEIRAEQIKKLPEKWKMIDELIDDDLDTIGAGGWEDWATRVLRSGLGSVGYNKWSIEDIQDEYMERFNR